MNVPVLSIVIPVFNEQACLHALFERLYPALDALGRAYELIFVDDGSRDRSVAMLRDQHARRPDVTRVIVLSRNFGQHSAILAGFEASRGELMITLDADLQNPPEEIGTLVEAWQAGHDYVGTIRRTREDVAWRRIASRTINRIREATTPIRITDHGCMLRAYSRRIVDEINRNADLSAFLPALGYIYASNPTEITVAHEERVAGESKYSLYRLIRLNFDLMTGYTLVPLQLFSMIGIGVAGLSGALFVLLAVRRIVIGPEEGGLFTLFALAFFLIGIALMGIGLLGEYVGRIYQEVRGRPHWQVAHVIERRDDRLEPGPMLAGVPHGDGRDTPST